MWFFPLPVAVLCGPRWQWSPDFDPNTHLMFPDNPEPASGMSWTNSWIRWLLPQWTLKAAKEMSGQFKLRMIRWMRVALLTFMPCLVFTPPPPPPFFLWFWNILAHLYWRPVGLRYIIECDPQKPLKPLQNASLGSHQKLNNTLCLPCVVTHHIIAK